MKLEIHHHYHCSECGDTTAKLAALYRELEAMSEALNTFAADVNAKLDVMGNTLTAIGGDITFLKDEIAKLNNLSPEDQATLDGVKQRVAVMADRMLALDAETTPPAPPAPEPTPEPTPAPEPNPDDTLPL